MNKIIISLGFTIIMGFISIPSHSQTQIGDFASSQTTVYPIDQIAAVLTFIGIAITVICLILHMKEVDDAEIEDQ